VLLRVTLPRAGAAVGAAALWVALQTATEITVTDMMQVRTFAEEVYTQFVRPEVEAGADADAVLARAVAVSVPALVGTWMLTVAVAGRWERRLPPPDALTAEPWTYRLGWWRWLAAAGVAAALAVLVGVPVGGLVWKLGVQGHPPSWSADVAGRHLANALRTRGGLVGQSLLLAAGAGVLTAGVGLVVSWLAVGARRFQVFLLSLLAVAWALPGPVLGLGLKDAISIVLDVTDSQVAADLLYYGPSPLPALWAYLVRFLPYAVALVWPVVRLWPRELHDLARLDGLSPVREFWLVVRPLTAAAFVRAALAVAVLSLGELSAGKLVETPGSQTFSHEVFNQMHYGVGNDLAALCLLLLAAVLVGAAVVGAFRLKNPFRGAN
jgi:iron(III) transport system permease protein